MRNTGRGGAAFLISFNSKKAMVYTGRGGMHCNNTVRAYNPKKHWGILERGGVKTYYYRSNIFWKRQFASQLPST